jgi:hypothetical protein
VDNNFSGATVVQDCELVRCGGYDHDWAWRAAYQICLDRRSISGLQVSRISIRDSISDGLSVVAPGRSKGEGTLADTRIEDLQIGRCGLARPSREFWIRNDVSGGLSLQHSDVGTILNESPTFTIDRR